MKLDPLETALRDGRGVVTRAQLSPSTLHRAVNAGRLHRLMPGVYCASHLRDDLATRARAVATAHPNAVLTGRVAAALTWWPGLTAPRVTASLTSAPGSSSGFRFSEAKVPPQHRTWVDGVFFSTPAWTVLDLISDLGGAAIDEALRRRAVTLDELHIALADRPHRRGNVLRRRLLLDSRDEPWSEAERAFHQILRRCRLPERFRANYAVTIEGERFYLDAALPELRRAFEVDGYEHHGSRRAFEYDRHRDALLGARGWHVTRFSAASVLTGPDDVAATVEQIVRLHARRAA